MSHRPIREFIREDCPICGHRAWCGRRNDALVLCKRPPVPREVQGFKYMGMAKDGVTAMYVEAGKEFVRERSPMSARAPAASRPAAAEPRGPSSEQLEQMHSCFVEACTKERREALAQHLGLPVTALDALPIGWYGEKRFWNREASCEEGEPGCWTFPESDAHEHIIGFGLRWPDGRKGQVTGGRRGLILPAGWRERPEPTLIVEGASDVLAGNALGLSVIGRPNNSGGTEIITYLCRRRRVILLGENDCKPDGSCPGAEGARAVARRLEQAWSRPVPVSMPPEGIKDLRAWLVDRLDGGKYAMTPEELEALGHEIRTIVEPPRIQLVAAARTRRGGRVSVRAFEWPKPIDSGPIHSDKLDLDSAKDRTRYVGKVVEIDPSIDRQEIEERLRKLEVPDAIGTEPRTRAPQALTVDDAPAGEAPGGLPRIQGNERQLRTIRLEALDALAAANQPPRLFRRGNQIVRVVDMRAAGDTSLPGVQSLDADALRGELSNSADWFEMRHLKSGDFEVEALPPLSIANDILALPEVGLPKLSGVVTHPTFAPDGSLILEQGYHAASCLWHHPTLEQMPEIPDLPYAEQIAAALGTLLDVLVDFPFVDAASRANTLAMMLLPFVRFLISGPTPLHAVDAPTAGSGKTLLVIVALWPALGCQLDIRTGARDPDEWRKRITSELQAGRAVVAFDNASKRLDSEHLAAVLTTTVWSDRDLGISRMLILPNNALWACTGNNLSFSKEMARRVVWIRLDPKVEAPEQRTGFRHPNIVAHVQAHRGEFVLAALTLVRAWQAAGCPKGKEIMGSFEAYAEVMGGILQVAGVQGFLSNAVQLKRQSDSETAEWRAVVLAWWERWRDAEIGVRDLSKLLWDDANQRSEMLPTVVTSTKDRGAVTQLGAALSKKRDCRIAGYRIDVLGGQDNSGRLRYRLVPDEPQTSGSPVEGLAQVCGEVCTPNSSDGNGLGSVADLCRPSNPCLPYTRINDIAHQCAGESSFPACALDIQKRSAKVCDSPQVRQWQELTHADLNADLPQTFTDPPPRSARGGRPTPRIDWYRGNGEVATPTVIELARLHDGWTAESWHSRLLQMADVCAHHIPERAAELRQAAALMQGIEEANNGTQ